MSGFDYFKDVLTNNYANFEGRARRSEYWYYALFNGLIALVLYALALKVPMMGILYLIYALATLIPGLAVAIRRLHDTGRSGWWLLIALVPFIGAIVLIVFFATDSQPGSNEFGPNPKEFNDDIADNLV